MTVMQIAETIETPANLPVRDSRATSGCGGTNEAGDPCTSEAVGSDGFCSFHSAAREFDPVALGRDTQRTETKQPIKQAFDPVESGRKGGIKSGEVRRRKARGRHFLDVSAEVLKEDPDTVVRSILASSNGAAKVKLLELTWQRERAQQRQAELRYEELDRKTDNLDRIADRLLDEIERDKATQEQLHAELDELWRQREELRKAIKAEAEAAGMELVDEPDDDGGGDDAALAQTTAT